MAATIPTYLATILNFIISNFVIANILAFLIFLLILVSIILLLSRKIKYQNRVVEIKEAPIGINNLLKDSIKRSILKALKREKKYLSRVAMEIGMNPARARFHLKQLESFGLLTSYKLTRESYYSLTDKGKWCIRALEKYYPETTFRKIRGAGIKLNDRSNENWLRKSALPVKFKY